MKTCRQAARTVSTRLLKSLEKRTRADRVAFEHEQLMHELQVHQIELETQNQALREAQRLVEESRDRYADLYDFAPVGYVTFDGKGIIREINLTAAGMLGVERARLVGMPFHLHVKKEDLAQFRPHLSKHPNPEERIVTEQRLVRKARGDLTVVIESVPDGAGKGKEHTRRAVIIDVTERRKTEETLREETAERKRLEIATRSAERLAAMGVMAAELAHEVRNPLGSIVLNLDLLLKEVNRLAGTRPHSPEEGRLLVNEIRAEVRRVQHVLEDYMQFARRSKPQRRPLALNDFIEQKLAFKLYQFEHAGVNLNTVFDPSLTIVEVDGEQVWQAILNLIRNSLEAMPDGGELAVSTRRDGAHAAVRVRDTGCGMSEEQLKDVFDPFFTTKEGGTGLGLALVHQIVTEHGGHVECEGTIGKGSTFTIFLPLKQKT